ncbi:transcription factor IIIC subunit delta N-term-domain-containing protein [Exophiala viscosa]|uniref:transcription factor IIIC subunit delta N-term-domain-containing protein n=1 Tax=Exophiala viscosa TaxID=2486360 RepID=UPI002196263F|nr:transcription factor IIIC subunit delta N-term-domain-containing protein [Exophiala viscosa]
MASQGPLRPVELPYWPTCREALSWSEHDLAVAAGEVVHILTPRDVLSPQEDPGQKQWHKFTLRVNQFEQAEWPYQELANIKHVSFGEEISDSTIVSLAWSPPGVGLHRRSVLAVLTSNLVLSIWETDGRLGMWKRTCIVNQHLPAHVNRQDSSQARRQKRIRAFCWLPSVASAASPLWSPTFLVVADDTGTIFIFRVWKNKNGVYGHWSFEMVAQHAIGTVDTQSPLAMVRLSLRSIIPHSSPVSKLEIVGTGANGEILSKELLLQVSRYRDTLPQTFAVNIEEPTQGKAADPRGNTFKVSITEFTSGGRCPNSRRPSESIFEVAIQKPRSDFDDKFSLGGRIRLRYYGTSYSPDKSQAAACISLHPADMIEYGIPSTQHTKVVFAQIKEHVRDGRLNKDASAVHEEILQYMASTPADWIKKPLDWKIAKSATAHIFGSYQHSKALSSWAYSTLKLVSALSESEDRIKEGNTLPASNKDKESLTASGRGNAVAPENQETCEICEICDAVIPFSVPPISARCDRGHQFSRCNLSFIAIQEPGLSKYCAKCGRQFLDAAKLSLPDGPSLSQALFDKFDVCPYCQGKYRG